MKFLPVFEYLNCTKFLVFVIKALEHDTECTSAKLLVDLISVVYLILCFINVVRLVVAESVVEDGCCVFLRILVKISNFFLIFTLAFQI
jgi:hypothetical protein